jgi:hypothetical protein
MQKHPWLTAKMAKNSPITTAIKLKMTVLPVRKRVLDQHLHHLASCISHRTRLTIYSFLVHRFVQTLSCQRPQNGPEATSRPMSRLFLLFFIDRPVFFSECNAEQMWWSLGLHDEVSGRDDERGVGLPPLYSRYVLYACASEGILRVFWREACIL